MDRLYKIMFWFVSGVLVWALWAFSNLTYAGEATSDNSIQAFAQKPEEGKSIVFRGPAGFCTAAAPNMFVYVNQAAKQMWFGCWVKIPEGIAIVYEDGDAALVPNTDIHWVTVPTLQDEGKKAPDGSRGA